MQADARFAEQFDGPGVVSQGLEGPGKEMEGALTGTDDRGRAPGFLEADAGCQAGQAAADDDGIEFHRPRTCL